jgi:glycosyltransferase involved in cell wall biosynthesis
MRVLMTGSHPYPLPAIGTGRNPKPLPSAAGQRVHDTIAKGLAKLGHDVRYFLTGELTGPPPAGVTIVDRMTDADIFHITVPRDEQRLREWNGPWVATCHVDLRTRGGVLPEAADQWIFVSRALAASHGKERWVLNGIDPDDYLYSEQKGDYLLFLASIEWALRKGLDLALAAAREAGVRIVVAGTGRTAEQVELAASLCTSFGAEYAGDVQGEEKARLLAHARALILPTRINDACPLSIAEALASGTPVIASANGGCPELVSSDVGFICQRFEDYVRAIREAGSIAPAACRAKAMSELHYLRMARDYVREYENELVRFTSAPSRSSSM